MALETELEYFEKLKPELLKHSAGKFALIVQTELLGTFDDPSVAYAHGIERKGNVPMLIKLISENEPPVSVPALTLGVIGGRL